MKRRRDRAEEKRMKEKDGEHQERCNRIKEEVGKESIGGRKREKKR